MASEHYSSKGRDMASAHDNENERYLKLGICIWNDHRQGAQVYIKGEYDDDEDDKEKEEDEEEDYYYDHHYFDLKFELPTGADYRLYYFRLWANPKVLLSIDCNTRTDYINQSNKIFSQIYDCLPFVVTGMTCGYTDTGYYPEIPEQVANLPHIDNLECDADNEYTIIVLDRDGSVHFRLAVNPF